MKKYIISAMTAVMLSGTAASAADIIMQKETAPEAAFSWDGFYAGGQIGGSWAQGKGRAWDADSSASMKAKPDGFIGGLYAGYNFDAGYNIILGADTDFVWGDVKDTASKNGVKYSVKQKWVGSTRLRAGYAMDRFLPYIAAGVAYGKLDNSVNFDFPGVSKPGFRKNKTRAGWTVGTGVDYAMTDNILLRAEYRYTDFGKKTYDDGARVKYNAHDVRLGVAYKF